MHIYRVNGYTFKEDNPGVNVYIPCRWGYMYITFIEKKKKQTKKQTNKKKKKKKILPASPIPPIEAHCFYRVTIETQPWPKMVCLPKILKCIYC